MPVRQDVETGLASLDQEWRELKKPLKGEVQNTILTEKQDSQVNINNSRLVVKKEASTSETVASPPLPDNKINIAVSPLEEEGNIERLRKSYEETKIFERLARVESQYRRLKIYGFIIFTLMFVFMLFSTYLLKETHSLLGKSQIKVSKGIKFPQPTEKGSHSLKADAQPQISATAGAPNPPEAPPLAPKTPKVEYVGSITSNKYHYRDCKWAKTIIPRKVRVFHSVAEAQKAGYIRCPACNPPLTDEPNKSTR
jgi:hypothetical protein